MADTPATVYLKAQKVAFTEHEYDYVEHGGTEVSAKSLGVPEHAVVKTLVMQDEAAKPLIVLMHGDRKVSTKNLARQAGRKRIEPCRPEVAQRHTGYQVGGTSPFGTRKKLPVYLERSIIELPKIYINGGAAGISRRHRARGDRAHARAAPGERRIGRIDNCLRCIHAILFPQSGIGRLPWKS